MLHSTGQTNKLEKLAKLSSSYALSGCLIFGIILGSLAPMLIISMYGQEYYDSIICTRILIFGWIISASFGLAGHLLYMSGYNKKVATVQTESKVIKILFAIALVPFFGPVGAAFSTLIDTVYWNSRLRAIALRLLHINTFAFAKM